MNNEEIKNLIKELVEKTGVAVIEISVTEEAPKTWFKVGVGDPHFFVSREGEGLFALNHVIRKIVEKELFSKNLKENIKENVSELDILIDINGFQKKRIESIRAVAHMMAERARYFKSNIEVDPMPSFERRVVHEFLGNETDLKTESVGFGPTRRVIIKYIGPI